jgi:hypothetical protein
MKRTAAELQIEALKQLKEAKARRKPAPLPPVPRAVPPLQAPKLSPAVPVNETAPPSGHAAFELSEGERATPKAKTGPALPLSKDSWRRLRERQRETREFRSRKAMGDWAAELVLAMPPQASKLGPEGKAELFKRIEEWCRARGLR